MSKNPHAVALGRKGGSVTSHKKAGASRENGKLGGRPKKRCEMCEKYFAEFSCGAWRGECDCPKCQGMCACEKKVGPPQ